MADEMRSSQFGGAPILVIQADAAAREMLANLLNRAAHHTRRAWTLDEARRLATEAGSAFAVVDLGMPVGSTSEATALKDAPVNGHAGDSREAAAPSVRNLKDVVDSYIAHVIGLCGGNKTQAARLLGISRETLRVRMHAVKRAPHTTGSSSPA